MRFRRILLPIDFSELSVLGAQYARALRDALGCELEAIHVVPVPPAVPAAESFAALAPVATEVDRELAEERLRAFVAEHVGGAPAQLHVRVGSAALEITTLASERGCDLIVMGTHADGILKRIVFGSVSKAVLESAPCAVLLVPRAAAAAAASAPAGRSSVP